MHCHRWYYSNTVAESLHEQSTIEQQWWMARSDSRVSNSWLHVLNRPIKIKQIDKESQNIFTMSGRNISPINGSCIHESTPALVSSSFHRGCWFLGTNITIAHTNGTFLNMHRDRAAEANQSKKNISHSTDCFRMLHCQRWRSKSNLYQPMISSPLIRHVWKKKIWQERTQIPLQNK